MSAGGAPRSPHDGPRTAARPSTRARAVFLWVSGIVAVVTVIVAHGVMLPFILGLVVAYVLTPAVLRIERLRVPRWAAVLIVYALVLGSVSGFIALIVPRLVAEGKALTAEGPRLAVRARERWLPALDARLQRWTGRDIPAPEPDSDAVEAGDPPAAIAAPPEDAPDSDASIRVIRRSDGSFDVIVADDVQLRETQTGVWKIEQARPRHAISSVTVLQEAFDKAVGYLRENSFTLLKIGQAIVAAISRGIFTLFMTLMLGAYLIITHERIFAFFRELWPPGSRGSFDRFIRRLDRGLAGVVRGQLLICLVNGVLSAIGFWLFELKYWPILAVLAALMSLIPIFGSILSSIPAVAIGLTQSSATAFGVLAWIVGIHQLEANFLNPKIIGDAAKIHPVLVVFSLLVGEHFFQIAGALFAVPCMSVAQTIFLHFRTSTLGLADPTASIPPQYAPVATPAVPGPPLVPKGLTAAGPPSPRAAAADDHEVATSGKTELPSETRSEEAAPEAMLPR